MHWISVRFYEMGDSIISIFYYKGFLQKILIYFLYDDCFFSEMSSATIQTFLVTENVI